MVLAFIIMISTRLVHQQAGLLRDITAGLRREAEEWREGGATAPALSDPLRGPMKTPVAGPSLSGPPRSPQRQPARTEGVRPNRTETRWPHTEGLGPTRKPSAPSSLFGYALRAALP